MYNSIIIADFSIKIKQYFSCSAGHPMDRGASPPLRRAVHIPFCCWSFSGNIRSFLPEFVPCFVPLRPCHGVHRAGALRSVISHYPPAGNLKGHLYRTFVVFLEKALQMQAKLLLYKYMFPLWRAPSCIGCNASAAHDGRKVEDMSEKKLAASAAAQTPEAHDT